MTAEYRLLFATLFTIYGVLFHVLLYQEAKANVEAGRCKRIGDDPIWIFVCFPGALTWLGPVGMYMAILNILYP